MDVLNRLDWRRGVEWLRLAVGPLLAVGAVVLLWAMSNTPTSLVRVPELAGLRADAANAAAGGLGFQTRDVRVVHGGVAGTVVGQDPKAGAYLARGATVTVAVTLGARQVVVPQVAGLPVDQARDALTGAGLSVGAVIYRDYPQGEPGRVVATSPAAGARVDEGTPVDMDAPLPPRQ
jgi:serine/threonine-protein kinase